MAARAVLNAKGLLKPLFNDDGNLNPNTHAANTFRKSLENIYHETGLVVVRNTGLKTIAAMQQVSSLLFGSDDGASYVGGANARQRIAGNVYDTGAPSAAYVHYHHEMQYVNRSPEHLTFMALAVPQRPSRGATYFTHNGRVTRDLLRTPLGDKMRELGVCYVRTLSDARHALKQESRPVYNTWQLSMTTQQHDEASAEGNCAGTGA